MMLLLKRISREPMGLFGLILVVIICLSALLANVIAPYDPIALNIVDRLQGPSASHLLGTDQLGRDLFSRVLYGGQVALKVALISISLALSIGVLLGMLAGFGPSWLDSLIMLFFDTIRSFPTVMFALATVALVGPSLGTVIVVIVITSIPNYGRVIRTQTLSIKNNEFIQAERVMGASLGRILRVHVLPNVMGPLMILASMDIPTVIALEAGLSFLGMGVKPPTPSWGSILNDGYTLIRNTPWPIIAGSIPLVLITLGFTFLGESLRDLIDPKLRKSLWTDNVLTIKDLSVHYETSAGVLKALRHINLDVPRGSIVGVVGESGCGKSTLIGSIIRLLAENAIVPNGSIDFEGQDLIGLSEDQMRAIRGRSMSIVFQDPMSTLNPVLSIGRQMVDIQYRDNTSNAEKLARSTEMLARVGIPDPAGRLKQFPHEFSGGMQQRISIAMALQANPSLLIADEPTTALDATLEVQIIHLLKELQTTMGCSILFISHHLGVIAELCDFVVVMYAGEVVEEGSVRDVFHRPAHPYTQKLLQCDPAVIVEKSRHLPTIPGEIPNLVAVPPGCVFRDRCDLAIDQCGSTVPAWNEHRQGHFVSCHVAKP